MTGAPTIVLVAPAADSFPARPASSLTLDSDLAVALLSAELAESQVEFQIV